MIVCTIILKPRAETSEWTDVPTGILIKKKVSGLIRAFFLHIAMLYEIL